MRALFRSLRLAWRTLSLAARLLVVAMLLVVWLAASVLTAAIPTVFRVASSVAGLVVDAGQTVRGRHAIQVQELDRKLARKQADAEALVAENARLKRKLDDAGKVIYRGQKRAIKEAVSDTSEGIAKRTARAAARNVAAMPGEAIPVYGIAVVVGATAWEVNDACQMMGDMHELDVAFNPDHAISDREVCGMRVPTAKELWDKINAAPSEVWRDMKESLPDLPELRFGDRLGALLAWVGRLDDWIWAE